MNKKIDRVRSKKGFPTDWLRSEHAKSSCFLLPVAVRVSKTSVLKFPSTDRRDLSRQIIVPINVISLPCGVHSKPYNLFSLLAGGFITMTII